MTTATRRSARAASRRAIANAWWIRAIRCRAVDAACVVTTTGTSRRTRPASRVPPCLPTGTTHRSVRPAAARPESVPPVGVRPRRRNVARVACRTIPGRPDPGERPTPRRVRVPGTLRRAIVVRCARIPHPSVSRSNPPLPVSNPLPLGSSPVRGNGRAARRSRPSRHGRRRPPREAGLPGRANRPSPRGSPPDAPMRSQHLPTMQASRKALHPRLIRHLRPRRRVATVPAWPAARSRNRASGTVRPVP